MCRPILQLEMDPPGTSIQRQFNNVAASYGTMGERVKELGQCTRICTGHAI